MAFVIAYTAAFGADQNIVGVVILLCVMVFRFADFGFRTTQALACLMAVFGILTFGPRLANMGGAFGGLFINALCIEALMLFSCHNVLMANHSTLVLGYLLLYGYDVSGSAFITRIGAMAFGALLTGIVFYLNHRRKEYKRDFWHLFREFDLHSSRTRWQLTMALGVSSIIFLMELFGLPRAMWAGIATMSILVPFPADAKKRVMGRIPGNLFGGLLFLILYYLLPESLFSYMGIIGGIGVGLSATYGWQSVFNSLGAMAIASSFLGIPGAIFCRIFHNACGALYGLLFGKIFQTSVSKLTDSWEA